MNPANSVIWTQPHQLLSWAEAFPKVQTRAGVLKSYPEKLILYKSIFLLTNCKAYFLSFHTENCSIVYFIFKISFCLGNWVKSSIFPMVPRIRRACWQISFLPSYVKFSPERKKMLQNLVQKLRKAFSHRRQASHSSVMTLTSGRGSASGIKRQKPPGSTAYLCLECVKDLTCDTIQKGLDEMWGTSFHIYLPEGLLRNEG